MAERKVRQGVNAEDLGQVASVISFLVQLDQRGQEHIHEAEQQARQMLDSVGAEIAVLEQQTQEQVEARLSIYTDELKKNSARTVADAEERYRKTHQTLVDRAQLHKEAWIDELLRRVLQE